MTPEHQAREIHHYWHDRGYKVETRLKSQPFNAVMRECRQDVRSDMLNGWPKGFKR